MMEYGICCIKTYLMAGEYKCVGNFDIMPTSTDLCELVSKCPGPPQDHLACGLSVCLTSSRSAVQVLVFRNLDMS